MQGLADINYMNISSGVQKISSQFESPLYIYPTVNQNPVQEISKIKNESNYFKTGVMDSITEQAMNSASPTGNEITRGMIFDLTA